MWVLAIYDLILGNFARRDKIITINLGLSLFINVILWIALILNFWHVNEFVVLRYNIYFGISAFGFWYNLLWLPLSGLIILLINFLLSFYFYKNQKFLSYLLVFTALCSQVIITTAVSLLIYINY